MKHSFLKISGTFYLYGVLTLTFSIYVILFIRDTYGLSDKDKRHLYRNKKLRSQKKFQEEEEKGLLDWFVYYLNL